MPLADSNGPRWARRSRAATEERLAGAGPIRRFLATLFGGRTRIAGAIPSVSPAPDDENPGAASAGRTAPLLPRVPTLAGSAARRLEDVSEHACED